MKIIKSQNNNINGGENSLTQISEKNFLKRLVEVIAKLSSIAKAQGSRFIKIWNDYLGVINDNPHKVRLIPLDEQNFISDIDYRINVLKTVEQCMVDGFYVIKSILETLYNSYFNNSNLFLKDFNNEDQIMLKYIAAREILGNLIQYNILDPLSVPLKYNILARNYLLLKLQGQKDTEIIDNMKKLKIEIDLANLHEIMNEIESEGFIASSKEGDNYSYKLTKELELSSEGKKKYIETGLLSIIDWPTQFWRSFYNVRELNVTVNEGAKYRDFLNKVLSKSATQGFGPANFVIKNLVKYFEKIKEDL